MALTDGVVSYWKLDETAGAVVDTIGTYAGTNNGATVNQTGKVNKCYSFDGANDYVRVNTANAYSSLTNGTLNFWVNPDTLTNSDYYFISAEANHDASWYIFGGKLRTFIFNNAAIVLFDSVTSISTGAWTMVTYTSDGSFSNLYINGVIDKANQAKGFFAAAGSAAATVDFGGKNGTTNALDGYMDEVGIWNRALTADEVLNLYRQGMAGFSYPWAVPGQTGTGTKGTRFVATRYPVTDGLTALTTTQTGHQENLIAQEGSLVPKRLKVGIS